MYEHKSPQFKLFIALFLAMRKRFYKSCSAPRNSFLRAMRAVSVIPATISDIARYFQESEPAEIMQMMIRLTKDKDPRTWTPLAPDNNQKNTKHSEELRNKGNKCYQERKLDEALLLYTKSIAFAPPHSEALAYAYANRGAVLKDLNLFMECIADCQRAIAAGYIIKSQFKLYYRQGQCYESMQQPGKAIQCFDSVCEILGCEDNLSPENQMMLDVLQGKLRYLNLEEVEEDCEDLTKDPSIGVLKFDIPTIANPNPELPAASDCIELKYSPELGRHLVATRDIELGEVLMVEEPFAAALLPEHFYSHCNYCFKRCSTLLPCPVCTWAMFCSEACIETSHNYHKMECQLRPGLKIINHSVQPLLLSAVFTPGLHKLATYFDGEERYRKKCNRKSGFNNDDKYVSTDVAAATNLYFHPPDDPECYMSVGLSVASLFLQFQFDKLNIEYELGGYMLKLALSLNFNANGVTEFHKTAGFSGEIKPLAQSIYPTFCLMNNSCIDNTFYHFYGRILVLRAGCFIKKGEQIFSCAGKSFLKYPKEYRQAHFKQNQFYTCKCEACLYNWPTQENQIPVPSFYDDEFHLHSEYMPLYMNIMKEGIGDLESGWRVTEATLPYFKALIEWMDKCNKKHNGMYYIMRECVRMFYNLKGNHVRHVEDDGLRCVDLSGTVLLEVQTIISQMQQQVIDL